MKKALIIALCFSLLSFPFLSLAKNEIQKELEIQILKTQFLILQLQIQLLNGQLKEIFKLMPKKEKLKQEVPVQEPKPEQETQIQEPKVKEQKEEKPRKDRSWPYIPPIPA